MGITKNFLRQILSRCVIFDFSQRCPHHSSATTFPFELTCLTMIFAIELFIIILVSKKKLPCNPQILQHTIILGNWAPLNLLSTLHPANFNNAAGCASNFVKFQIFYSCSNCFKNYINCLYSLLFRL